MCGAVTLLPNMHLWRIQRQLCFYYASSITCVTVVSTDLKSFIGNDKDYSITAA